VSSKFFSLIHGDGEVHIAPKTHVLPSEAFSSLMNAQELLDLVKLDAEKYKKAVVTECENLKEQAQKEGFEEGFNKWAKHILELEQETQRVHEEVQKVVIPLALQAAKKIVGREIKLTKETTVDIVANSLKAVAQHKNILIYVNKQDVEILETNKPKLKALFEQLETLSIKERDDIEPGGCIIETEAGIINAQLPHQWQILEKAFASLMQTSTKSNSNE